jgi:hypothetical protein
MHVAARAAPEPSIVAARAAPEPSIIYTCVFLYMELTNFDYD